MVLRLLEFKELTKRLYSRFDIYIKIIVKFIISLVVFSIINNTLGGTALDSPVIVLGLSVICAFTPDMVIVVLASLVTVIDVYSISIIFTVVLAVLFILIYLLFVRFAPKQAFIILALPVMYVLNMQYLVPLICGIFMSPVAAISCAVGTFLYYLLQSATAASTVSEGNGVADTVNFFKIIVDDIMQNKFMMVSIIIFAVVVIITYIIKRLKVRHAAYMAILIGTLINIVTFLVASAYLEKENNIGYVLITSIISAFIVCVSWFFRITLDYAGAKNIQFEDDEYYYYVKAVPKLTVAEPQKQVKRINPQKPTGNTSNLSDVLTKTFDEDVSDKLE